MEITPQILDDPDLFRAYVEGSQRILFDEARDLAERVHAGCALAYLATVEEGEEVRPWGTVPASLPDDLHEAWTTAFSDLVEDADRLPAVVSVYYGLAHVTMAEAGAEILRRELG